MKPNGPYGIRITDADGNILYDDTCDCILFTAHSIHQSDGKDETVQSASTDCDIIDIANCIRDFDKLKQELCERHNELKTALELQERSPLLYTMFQKAVKGDKLARELMGELMDELMDKAKEDDDNGDT